MSEVRWLIMHPQRFDAMELTPNLPLPFLGDHPITTPTEPYWYLPLFESREAAVAWNGGSEENIVPVRMKEKP